MNSSRSFLYTLVAGLIIFSCACEEYGDEFDDAQGELHAVTKTVTYQAEDRSFQSGCKEMSNKPGYTGRSFMDYGGNGSLVEWNNVSAPSAGQYALVFRYANGSAGNRQCGITVNGTVNAGNVAFGKTGSWTTWRTSSIKVTLKRGNNKIRVTANTGSGGPNLDKVDLVYEEDAGGGTDLATKGFVGHYERTPVLNNWHKVDIALVNNALRWKNAAGATWSLSYADGVLKTGSDCPYGVNVIEVEKQSGSDSIRSLKFNRESYYKDACPSDPNKTEPGKCGCGIPETECSGGCVPACSAPTPICGPDLKCTSTRWVEPISTLPDKWKSTIDTSVWTKWVRSVIPVIGQASTQNAALLEVAYYAEKIHMPQGRVLVPDLINSMLGAHPTRFSVYPACPNAYMHPAVKPTMSSGGGGWTNTLVTEDWVLRYPKCTGKYAVACDAMPKGVLCNNCQWQNASAPETCRDTLAHEHGHTCDLHRRNYLDSSVEGIAKQVFSYNDIEGPAWAASKYFMNPSLETSTGRDSGNHIMSSQEMNYWSVTQKFTMSKYPPGSGYILKTTRCPQMGLTQACPDTLARTYAVPLDSYGKD